MKYKIVSHFILHSKAILTQEGGIAFIEIALSLPLLLIILFATIEVSDYIILTKRVQNVASEIANLTTTMVPASGPNQLAPSQLFNNVPINALMAPYPVDLYSGSQYGHEGEYRVFISDISQTAGNVTVNWVYDSANVQYTGAGMAQGSDLGSSGNTPFQFSATQQSINPLSCGATAATISQSLNGFTFTQDGQEIIVANFYYTYNSITNLLTIPGVPLLPYYHGVAVFTPRGAGYNNSGDSSIAVPPTGLGC